MLNEQTLEWYSWGKGYEKTIEEDKTILVFVHASWCHWCKRMFDKTYPKEEVKSLIIKNYVAVKFDIEKEEKYMYKEEEYKENKLLGVLTDN